MYYVADKSRLATTTGVALLGERRLIVTHLVGQSMSLLQFYPNDWHAQQICSVDTHYRGERTVTDLVDFDGVDTIVTSNFEANSASLYKLSGTQIDHHFDIALPAHGGHCHGAKFYNEDMVCLSTDRKRMFFYDTQASHIVAELRNPYFIKDICFLDTTTAVAPFVSQAPTLSKQNGYASGIILFTFDLQRCRLHVLDTVYFMLSAFDAICKDKHTDSIYVTDQYNDRVIVAKVIEQKLSLVGQLTGFDFPHGIDTDGDILAVTNYGTSQLHVLPVAEMSVESLTGEYGSRRSLGLWRESLSMTMRDWLR